MSPPGSDLDRKRRPRWNQKDEGFLLYNAEEMKGWLAPRLGRSEKSVKEKLLRLGVRLNRIESFSLEKLANESKHDPSVILKMGRALGQRWRTNGKEGKARRYRITIDQAEAIVRALDGNSRSLDEYLKLTERHVAELIGPDDAE